MDDRSFQPQRPTGSTALTEQKKVLMNTLLVEVVRAWGCPKVDLFGTVDPFIVISYSEFENFHRTKTKNNEYNPVWDEMFDFPLSRSRKIELKFDFYDDNTLTAPTKFATKVVKLNTEDIYEYPSYMFPFSVGFQVSKGTPSKLIFPCFRFKVGIIPPRTEIPTSIVYDTSMISKSILGSSEPLFYSNIENFEPVEHPKWLPLTAVQNMFLVRVLTTSSKQVVPSLDNKKSSFTVGNYFIWPEFDPESFGFHKFRVGGSISSNYRCAHCWRWGDSIPRTFTGPTIAKFKISKEEFIFQRRYVLAGGPFLMEDDQTTVPDGTEIETPLSDSPNEKSSAPPDSDESGIPQLTELPDKAPYQAFIVYVTPSVENGYMIPSINGTDKPNFQCDGYYIWKNYNPKFIKVMTFVLFKKSNRNHLITKYSIVGQLTNITE